MTGRGARLAAPLRGGSLRDVITVDRRLLWITRLVPVLTPFLGRPMGGSDRGEYVFNAVRGVRC